MEAIQVKIGQRRIYALRPKQCSRCCRVFTNSKVMEKHLQADTCWPPIPVEMEAEKDSVKDAYRDAIIKAERRQRYVRRKKQCHRCCRVFTNSKVMEKHLQANTCWPPIPVEMQAEEESVKDAYRDAYRKKDAAAFFNKEMSFRASRVPEPLETADTSVTTREAVDEKNVEITKYPESWINQENIYVKTEQQNEICGDSLNCTDNFQDVPESAGTHAAAFGIMTDEVVQVKTEVESDEFIKVKTEVESDEFIKVKTEVESDEVLKVNTEVESDEVIEVKTEVESDEFIKTEVESDITESQLESQPGPVSDEPGMFENVVKEEFVSEYDSSIIISPQAGDVDDAAEFNDALSEDGEDSCTHSLNIYVVDNKVLKIVPDNTPKAKAVTEHYNVIDDKVEKADSGDELTFQLTTSNKDSSFFKIQLKMSDDEEEIKNLSCDICGATFASPDLLELHTNRHMMSDDEEETKELSCDICGAIFAARYLLELHTNRHMILRNRMGLKNQHVWTCHICFKTYNRRSSLRHHLITHTSRFKCEYCGKTQQSAAELEYHIRRHLGIRTHQCTICQKASTSFDELGRHLKTHFGNTPTCDICSRVFLDRATLRRHRYLHLPHKCNCCPDAFLTSQILAMHKNIRHTQCDICGLAFSEFRNLTRHKTVRHADIYRKIEIYPCSVCNKEFSSLIDLKIHKEVHSKGFSSLIELSIDKEVHSKYKCDICGVRFSRKAALREHRYSHLPYECNLCKEAFISNESVTIHKKLRHGQNFSDMK